MKRSEINQAILESESFFERRRFPLPPFASWDQANWLSRGEDDLDIVDRGLGWDVTDFGSGDFLRRGLVLFTLRNAPMSDAVVGSCASYAEKAMHVRAGQVTPMHFHWTKTEDIINRGGGKLVVQLFTSGDDGTLANASVCIRTDGCRRTITAGGTMVLEPGESVTLPPRLYHSFWAAEADVLVGEVSSANNDESDNRFLDECPRFPGIEEDEAPRRLMVCDYECLLLGRSALS